MREQIFAEYKSAYNHLTVEFMHLYDIQPVLDAINIVLSSAVTARKEGLLAVDEDIAKLDKNKELLRYYSELMELIMEGRDPDIVEEIGLYKLIAFRFDGVDKIAGVIYLLGSLEIQQGENPEMIEKKIQALVPFQWRKFLIPGDDANELGTRFPEESIQDKIEELENRESPITPEQDGYVIVRLTECVIQNFDNRAIQRLLRDVDNYDLEMAMKGMEGKTISMLLQNLSSRLAQMMVEDMCFMGAVKMEDVAQSNKKILLTAIDLMEIGAIVNSQYAYLKEYIRNIKLALHPEEDKGNTEELQKLLDEYGTLVHGIVE